MNTNTTLSDTHSLESRLISSHPAAELDPDQREAFLRFGNNTVLLPLSPGQATPSDRNWKSTTLAATRAAAYGNKLWDSNLAVLSGRESGNLCAVQIQDLDLVPMFLAANPRVAPTLMTETTDALHFWFRIEGSVPQSMAFQGFKWLGEGECVQVLDRERTSQRCAFHTDSPPLQIRFEELNWGWDRLAAFTLFYQNLVGIYGDPRLPDKKGQLQLNASLWAAFFAKLNQVRYNCTNRGFEKYDKPTATWNSVPVELIHADVNRFFISTGSKPPFQFLHAYTDAASLKKVVAAMSCVAAFTSKVEEDGVIEFINARVEPCDKGDVTSEELLAAYAIYTEERGLPPYSGNQFLKRVPQLLHDRFRVSKSHAIQRGSGSRRGWCRLRLRQPEAEAGRRTGRTGRTGGHKPEPSL